MVAYYNEKDEFAAAWLRNLVAANVIAPGDVDERNIQDVVPMELHKYTQCHFFAGIGVWSYSMRRAGWADDRRAWSGSCPCQPFSQAGEGAGFADERHLWPAFFHLIEQCGPDIVFGEQVASPDGLAWLDLVQSDMEAANYAFGALDTCVAGFGAPHIRQRLYWMADAQNIGHRGQSGSIFGAAGASEREVARQGYGHAAWPYGTTGILADADHEGLPQQRRNGRVSFVAVGAFPWQGLKRSSAPTGGLADDNGRNASAERQQRGGQYRQFSPNAGLSNGNPGSSPTSGFWDAVDWLRCRDDRWRPVEPGTFPLAHGAANRVGRLRGYGNAIVAPQAEEFIRVAMEYAP